MHELYAETSVLSGPYSRDKRIASISSAFWEMVRAEDVRIHISAYVFFEIGKTGDAARRRGLLDLAALCIDDAPSGIEVETLGLEYVDRGMIPRRYILDAYHVASASIGGFQTLVTWNFEHILREKTEKMLETINKEKRLHIPKLRSPEVFIW